MTRSHEGDNTNADRAVRRSDLPARFVEQFHPVCANIHDKGLSRFLFDENRLRFYREMAIAGRVPYNAIWSVVPLSDDGQLQLIAGELDEGLGYVVTDIARNVESCRQWILPRLLSYRQQIRLTAMRKLMQDLESASLQVPLEVMSFLQRYAEAD